MSPQPTIATATDSREDALVGTVLAGRYRVDRLLGEGGMGRVYLAEHVLMRKPVALKVLHPEMTAIPEVVSRFEREAVVAARIDHPNVALAMDFGHLEDGSLYFVLEYVDGRSLRQVLEEGPVNLGRALAIARQISSALVAAHDVGIVHRDLKPENVMLIRQPDGSDRVKVLDFGIAKITGEAERAVPGKTLTRMGAVIGTPGYMSPEQALGQPVNQVADLYAFGIMLYEMLAGRLPFEADEVAQVLAKQLTEPPAPLPPGVPADLVRLIETLLARSPADRLQSATELSTALEAITQQRLVASAPTAFLDDAAREAVARSERHGVAHTTLGLPEKRRPPWMAAGAVALVAAGAFAMLRLHAAEETAPSAEPSISAAPAAFAAPPPAAVAAPSAVASAPPSTSAEPAKRAESEPSPPPNKAETRSTSGAKSRKTRKTRVTEEHTVKRTRRHTGPGGIYIPPPSQWFK